MKLLELPTCIYAKSDSVNPEDNREVLADDNCKMFYNIMATILLFYTVYSHSH